MDADRNTDARRRAIAQRPDPLPVPPAPHQ
jgi:hypothetical protein